MSKQHHYIISYNTARNEWELDAEAEAVKYQHGTVYDYDNDSWHRDYSGDGEFYPEAERLSEAISKAIKQLNEGLEPNRVKLENQLATIMRKKENAIEILVGRLSSITTTEQLSVLITAETEGLKS